MSPTPNLRSRAALLPLPLVLVLLLALAQPAPAASVRLVVSSPTSGATVAAGLPINARLAGVKGSRVRIARFYVNGKRVSTDRSRPFATSVGAAFDTNALAAGKQRLKLSVRYVVRGRRGKLSTHTRTRRVGVLVFRPPAPAAPAAEPQIGSNWKLGFDDEFSAAATSASTWKTQRDDWIKGGRPYSNLEGAGYLASNVSVANGSLNLKTADSSASGYPLSTGSVNTHGSFEYKYGYLESRMLVPSCSGCWPAFWTLASDDVWPPEIDIIEFFNTQAEVFPYASLHWPASNAAKELSRNDPLRIAVGDNYVGTWHTYGVLWTKDQLQFYIDGVPGPKFSDPSQIPQGSMYPIIQLAVQSGHHPAAGSTMQVDYVRAWLPAP